MVLNWGKCCPVTTWHCVEGTTGERTEGRDTAVHPAVHRTYKEQ